MHAICYGEAAALGVWPIHRAGLPATSLRDSGAPSARGLDAGDCTVGGRDYRLVFGVQLTTPEGRVHVELQTGLSVGHILLTRVKDLQSVTSFAPCLVHRRSCIMEELFRSVIITASEGNSDPGSDLYLSARKDEWSTKRGVDTASDGDGLGNDLETFAEYDELVTRETGECVTGSQLRAHSLGGGDQQLVAASMTVHVVDRFEPVNDQRRTPLIWRPTGGLENRVLESLQYEDLLMSRPLKGPRWGGLGRES